MGRTGSRDDNDLTRSHFGLIRVQFGTTVWDSGAGPIPAASMLPSWPTSAFTQP